MFTQSATRNIRIFSQLVVLDVKWKQKKNFKQKKNQLKLPVLTIYTYVRGYGR